MKKVLAFILSMALVATSLVTVFAAEPKITCIISDTDVQMGEEFTVTVSISGYEPIRSGGIALDFDQTVLEYVDSEWLIDAGVKSFDPEKLNGIFMFFPLEAHDINGDIFRVTLKALADAPKAGSFDIVASPSLTNGNGEDVAEGDSGTSSVEISCAEHEYGDLNPEVPAKCGVEGRKAYYECSVCHKLFDESKTETTAEQLMIPALTHVAGNDWQSDADNHWKLCSNGCGTVMDKSAHEFEWVVDTLATEDAPGVQHEECTVCGYKRSENTEIPQLPHVHMGVTHHEAVAANCHETGTVEYWTCSSDKCEGKYYGNADCTEELASITSPIDPDNHDGGTDVRNAVEATCGKDGYTGDTYCLGCGEKISTGETIPATGAHANAAGEWKSDGENHWQVCDSCGTIFNEAAHEGGEATCSVKAVCTVCGTEYGELDPDNHVNTEIRDVVAATEETEGYTGDKWCLDCDQMIEQGTVVPKLDHTHAMVKTEAKPATCEEDGNIEYYTCLKCGKMYNNEAGTRELTNAEIVIKATGHSYGEEWKSDADSHWHECTCGERSDERAHTFGEWTVTKETTETSDGNRERECSVCGYVQSEIINATGEVADDDTNPGETDDPDNSKAPQTGDNSNVALWLALMSAGSCGIIVTAAARKKCKANK